jgi:hypothetical protein
MNDHIEDRLGGGENVEYRPSRPGGGRSGGPFGRLRRAAVAGKIKGLTRDKAAEIAGPDRADEVMRSTRQRDLMDAGREAMALGVRRMEREQQERERRRKQRDGR